MAQTATLVIRALPVPVQLPEVQRLTHGPVKTVQTETQAIPVPQAQELQTVMLALPEMLAQQVTLALRVTTVQALLRAIRDRLILAMQVTRDRWLALTPLTPRKSGRISRLQSQLVPAVPMGK
ncbi:MAG: hypothetical protein JSW30_05405, partial [Dehalococcoidia bacterium]